MLILVLNLFLQSWELALLAAFIFLGACFQMNYEESKPDRDDSIRVKCLQCEARLAGDARARSAPRSS